MNKEIADKNRKIAKFMGAVELAEYKGSNGGYFDTILFDFATKETKASNQYYPDNSRYWCDINMKYNSDWSWLMPVIKKCFELKEESIFFTLFYGELVPACFMKQDINIAFEVVTNFINLSQKDL